MANFDKKLVWKILGAAATAAGMILSYIADKPDEEENTEDNETDDK
jgi:hypothetical protein